MYPTSSARFGQSSNSIDSFEANLKQIEQTNQMLNNIENKLTDFFKSAEESSKKLREKNIDDTSFRRTGLDYKMGSENRSPNLYKSVTPYSPGEKTNPFTMSELNNRPLEANEEQHKEMTSRSQKSNYQTNTSPSFHNNVPSSKGDAFRSVENRKIGARIDDQHQDLKPSEFHSNRQTTDHFHSGADLIIERMSRMEEFYQNKIRIVEERAQGSERESQNLLRLNETLNDEMKRMRVDLANSKNEFLLELTRSLREQEERLVREFEKNIGAKDHALNETKRQAEKYAEKIEGLLNENERYSSESARYRARCEQAERDLEQISTKYQSLMNVHNEMIELDIQKNEKRLLTASPHQTSAFNSHPGVFSSPLRHQTPHNNYRQAYLQTPLSSTQNPEEVRVLRDSVDIYRRELESLKDNHVHLKRQFLGEIDRLKDDLKSQKDENLNLVDKMKRSSHINARQSSSRRQTEENDISKIIIPDVNLIKEDDLNKLNKEDLENYTRNLQSSYVQLNQNLRELEEKSRENIDHFNKAYDQIYGDNKNLNNTGNILTTYSDAGAPGSIPFSNKQLKTNLSRTVTSPSRSESHHQKNASDPPESKRASRSILKGTKKGESIDKTKSNNSLSTKREKSYENIEEEIEKLKRLVNVKVGTLKRKKKSAKAKKDAFTQQTEKPNSSRIPINLTTLRKNRSKSRSKSRPKKKF